MRRRRLLPLCAAFVLLALTGGARAASDPVKRPPSLLWKIYPLKQRTAASPHHVLRPPALAVGTGSSSGDEIVVTPYLAFLALLGGAMLALTGLAATSLVKEGATIMAARKGRSALPEPASTEAAKPDMLVALRPTSVTAEAEADLAESRTKTPVAPRLVQIEDEHEVEPERSEQAPSPPCPPPRALLHPLLRPLEEQPEVEAPSAEAEEQDVEPPPLDVEEATEPELEPESRHLWRGDSRVEDTEVVVERRAAVTRAAVLRMWERGHAVVRRNALDVWVWALALVLAVVVGLLVARL
jgi:hypothetical protein